MSASPIPDWIPLDAWSGFIEMRKKIKKAPTDRAIDLLIMRLAKMAEEGQNIQAVLEQSTMNNWQGVFDVREEKRVIPRPSNQPLISALGKAGQATANNALEWLEGQ